MWRNLTEAEADTLIAVADGDRNAFARLFYRYHQELGEYVYRLTKSRTISEEIVQDAFMKVWVNRSVLPGIRSFRAYLFTITRNHAFNTLRDESRKAFLSEELSQDLFLVEDTDHTAEDEELYGIVEKAVARLPRQQQKVWRMNKEEGLPYQQIADKLQLSRETVKRHIALAMASVLRYVKVHRNTFLLLGLKFSVYWL
ncbi:MAG: hypothetical protein ABS46_08365 [Cytophagaceae bacterium SCN 52-12]|nr:MAG: hypothetical protein ABS46_08365 [Cytophagaceae bacterium SCN 52-12]